MTEYHFIQNTLRHTISKFESLVLLILIVLEYYLPVTRPCDIKWRCEVMWKGSDFVTVNSHPCARPVDGVKVLVKLQPK